MDLLFQTIARRKRNDLYIQVVAGIVALLGVPFTWGISLYLLAIVQSVSAYYWIFAWQQYTTIPETTGRKCIWLVMVIGSLILLGTGLVDTGAFAELSLVMLFIGPVIGISYLIITLREVSFYEALAVSRSSN